MPPFHPTKLFEPLIADVLRSCFPKGSFDLRPFTCSMLFQGVFHRRDSHMQKEEPHLSGTCEKRSGASGSSVPKGRNLSETKRSVDVVGVLLFLRRSSKCIHVTADKRRALNGAGRCQTSAGRHSSFRTNKCFAAQQGFVIVITF